MARFEGDEQRLKDDTQGRVLPRDWVEIRREWPRLTAYQRYEVFIAFVLRIIIGIVALVALVRLITNVFDTLLLQALNPLDHTVFQQVFDAILTLLIALEFNHTLQHLIARERGIIQIRSVLTIAQLALARKVIVLDLLVIEPASVIAVAALILSLGVAHWLLRDTGHPTRRTGGRRRPSPTAPWI